MYSSFLQPQVEGWWSLWRDGFVGRIFCCAMLATVLIAWLASNIWVVVLAYGMIFVLVAAAISQHLYGKSKETPIEPQSYGERACTAAEPSELNRSRQCD